MRTYLFLLALPALAWQAQPPVLSPVVQADHSVIFRLRAPNAKQVFASIGGKRIAMQKDEHGIWTGKTDPLEPDYWDYTFSVDGVTVLDPGNSLVGPNLLDLYNIVHVPGPPSLVWEQNDVPHGIVHHHFYKSEIVGSQCDYFVYTPPGYDPAAEKLYPTLYLLHGFSDDASGWTVVGRANVILDNLIAQGKVKPMLIVMPYGYGAPEIVKRATAGMRDAKSRQKNMDKFREVLIQEVIPAVESGYRASKDRDMRAIAGLSMGGAESLYTGLNRLDRFAWVGAFSAGSVSDDFNASFPNLDAKADSQLRLLWIACGTDDRLIKDNRKFRDWLKTKDIKVQEIETPGTHNWRIWRRNLAMFAPLLFQ